MTQPPAWFGRLAGSLPELRFPPRDAPVSVRVPAAGSQPRHSAVLMLFGRSDAGEDGGVGAGGDDVLLTRRSSQLRAHAGQVAFPGGGIDPGDDGPAAAALREAREETGLDPAGVDVAALGSPLFVSVTNFVVTPVLAWWRSPSPVAPVDPGEVQDVVRVRLADLLDPVNRFTVRHPSGFAGPGFEVAGLFVWGFTAMVLSEVLRLAGLERPWDAGRAVPLDGRAGQIRYAEAEQVPE